jgi:TPR repeat protein
MLKRTGACLKILLLGLVLAGLPACASAPRSAPIVEAPVSAAVAARNDFDQGLSLMREGRFDQGREAIHKAALGGSPDAQRWLAAAYTLGIYSLPQDGTEALYWYRQFQTQVPNGLPLVLAIPGFTPTSLSEQDTREVRRLRAQAAYGDAPAQFKLGELYYQGVAVLSDYVEAADLFAAAAAQGHKRAAYHLGLLYRDGLGVDQDGKLAVRWLTRVADQGDVAAQYALADMYAMGLAVEKSEDKAFHWYVKAAVRGHSLARYRLARRYQSGVGVSSDLSQAARWYRRAAEQGHAPSQLQLAAMYLKGEGVAQDGDTATQWLDMAAISGSREAHLLLGMMYAQGSMVKQNFSKARRHLARAARLGDPQAEVVLNCVRQRDCRLRQYPDPENPIDPDAIPID